MWIHVPGQRSSRCLSRGLFRQHWHPYLWGGCSLRKPVCARPWPEAEDADLPQLHREGLRMLWLGTSDLFGPQAITRSSGSVMASSSVGETRAAMMFQEAHGEKKKKRPLVDRTWETDIEKMEDLHWEAALMFQQEVAIRSRLRLIQFKILHRIYCDIGYMRWVSRRNVLDAELD
ncbi:hypothetical protein NDU88_001051 [Pleurodeles waltl]|uniref:Uncharacterized protein n=1 Tax=Pleurodeles waltl TaxID=8319 RepID=A0AAV7TGI3_PLEWA|nr:hypothetical protein NDU88_001051 [Pleurodeles waltl]